MWTLYVAIIGLVWAYPLTKKNSKKGRDAQYTSKILRNFPVSSPHLSETQKSLVLAATQDTWYRYTHKLNKLRVPETEDVKQSIINNNIDSLCIKRINALMYIPVDKEEVNRKISLPTESSVKEINESIKHAINYILNEDEEFVCFYARYVEWTPSKKYYIGVDMLGEHNSIEIWVRSKERHNVAVCRYRKELSMWEDGANEFMLKESMLYIDLLASLGIIKTFEDEKNQIQDERWSKYGEEV